ncbi:MAG: flagellar motor switch protein FliM [Candidatus Marinimicrobia bacterium]|nr:flagellar motor switch protein FliM [Candidatus Neomarinimicrobiota bacterium]MCF7841150.1 flagellar motor switch protein FliM [Candidatus Neomarinimicrobiota bacterium]MCF7901949.1 flagellar motor switch protein FliM [Candidatus Neomarinimicrobiota bacterium]
MAKILSQAEIDALLTKVSSSEKNSKNPAKSDGEIALYDFKHPNLVPKEQLRLLESIHEGLIRNFSVFLSAQLRMIVDMKLLAIDQIMYSEFMMSITTPAAIYMGVIDEPYTQFILEIDPRLVAFSVERLFGGQGTFQPISRPISQIEQRVMRRIVDRFAGELQDNWAEMKKLKCDIHRFESNPEFVQIVPGSEPVVVISVEIKVHGNTSMLNICMPYIWISNIMSLPEIQEKILFGAHRGSREDRSLMVQNLHRTQVYLQARLGNVAMTINDVLNLCVGDVICTGTHIEQDVSVYLMNREVFHGSVGISSGQYSILIHDIIEGEKGNDSEK